LRLSHSLLVDRFVRCSSSFFSHWSGDFSFFISLRARGCVSSALLSPSWLSIASHDTALSSLVRCPSGVTVSSICGVYSLQGTHTCRGLMLPFSDASFSSSHSLAGCLSAPRDVVSSIFFDVPAPIQCCSHRLGGKSVTQTLPHLILSSHSSLRLFSAHLFLANQLILFSNRDLASCLLLSFSSHPPRHHSPSPHFRS
jgi:hypothetical protein